MKNVLLYMIFGVILVISSCSKDEEEVYICSCTHRSAANMDSSDVSSTVTFEFQVEEKEEAETLCINKEYRDGGFDMVGGGWVIEIKDCSLQ